MEQKVLNDILKDHKLWVVTEGKKGQKADLRMAYLYEANLCKANLYGADLRGADLHRADLHRADLRGADLGGAGFCWANLHGANLREADLREANLDFSSGIPFHCGGTEIKGDRRLFAQMVYHLTRQNWQGLSETEQQWLNDIPEEILNAFTSYRDDIQPIHKEKTK